MFKRSGKQVVSLQIFNRRCTGCESCVDRCRHRVLGMTYKEGNSYATVEYIERCVGCGGCAWVCPSDAIELITA